MTDSDSLEDDGPCVKMPHAQSSSAASSGDDLGSTDEVKVFKDEGDGEDEKRSSENLLEEKSSLIDWTESEVSSFVLFNVLCFRKNAFCRGSRYRGA